MDQTELIDKLNALKNGDDPESDHAEADRLLLEYIGSPCVTAAFDNIRKWYA